MGALRLAALGSFCICFVTIQPTHAASFRWAADGDVTTLDPYSRQETFQISFLSNIYEPLARRTPDLGLEPALATRWEQTSPTTWRFHLRPDVTWQDGSPFTADDVVFSLGRIQSPKSSMRVTMAPVREARKIDALTVEFETSVPDPILPQEQAQFLIMSKAWAERNNTVEPAVIAVRAVTRCATRWGPGRSN
jgi:peptide/nickel transport system substrate-binding protein